MGAEDEEYLHATTKPGGLRQPEKNTSSFRVAFNQRSEGALHIPAGVSVDTRS